MGHSSEIYSEIVQASPLLLLMSMVLLVPQTLVAPPRILPFVSGCRMAPSSVSQVVPTAIVVLMAYPSQLRS